ncbi:MAG: hypothetical protein IOD15_14625 [Phycisphaerales bacterium]|nr:hypothetical protein [Phycisphaerales bacterium]
MSQSGDVIVGGSQTTVNVGLPLLVTGGGGGGSTTLAGLSDVSVAGATNGQVLTYDGTVWRAQTPSGGGGGGVTDHGALTGLADDDHTQYLIGNVGTSTTRNSITMGVGGRGLNIDAVDGVDPWLRLTVGGVERGTLGWDNGFSIQGGVTCQTVYASDYIWAGASTTSFASLRLPHGTAPTSPVNGDIWTTTSGVFARVNGSTVGPMLGNGNAPGSTGQIIYNGGGGGFAANSLFTYTPGTSGGLRIDNGNILFGGPLPSRHTSTTVFALFPGGSNSNTYIGYNTGTAFAGLNINSNRVYDSGNNWVCADTSRPCWAMYMSHGTSADMFEISRGAATAGTANTTGILRIDQNLRSAFLAASFANTTGFTAKLAVDNVGGTASDAVLLLRCNAAQSGNIITTQTSGGTALFTIDSAGKANTIAPTTATASLTLPHGTAPSSPVNGDVWTTTAGMFVRVNGVTVGPLTQRGQCVRGVFGDGAEGDFTTTGNLTLTEPRFWDNLTVATGHTITTAGFRIHVRGTLTLNGTGAIRRDGAAGGTSTSATGGTAGEALTAQSTGASGAGTAGGNGTTTAGAQGAAPTALTAAMGVTNASVNSGAGGTGASGAGGAVRAGAAATLRRLRAFTVHLIDGVTILNGSPGGAGGGGGGGDTTNSGGGGGGGGSGGGICFIAARNIVLNTGTFITADGGAGGNGRTPTVGNCGGGGGGAGGAGGVVYLIYETLSNSGTISANGGAGGTGGAGVGTGTAGTNGGAGAAGLIIRYNTTLGAFE